MKDHRLTTLEKYASRALLALVTLVLIVMFLPINVLTNWKLTTDKDKYVIGEKLKLTSEYDKHYDIRGQNTRLLECKTATGWVQYPIFYGFSGTGTGHQKVNSDVTIPQIDQKLPVECHVRIDLLYTLVGVKPVAHHATSNDFWVIPK